MSRPGSHARCCVPAGWPDAALSIVPPPETRVDSREVTGAAGGAALLATGPPGAAAASVSISRLTAPPTAAGAGAPLRTYPEAGAGPTAGCWSRPPAASGPPGAPPELVEEPICRQRTTVRRHCRHGTTSPHTASLQTQKSHQVITTDTGRYQTYSTTTDTGQLSDVT